MHLLELADAALFLPCAGKAKCGGDIYGARGGECARESGGVTTQKGDKQYVHVLGLAEGALFVPVAGKVKSAVCLNTGKEASFTKVKGKGIVIDLGGIPVDEYDRIIELTTE